MSCCLQLLLLVYKFGVCSKVVLYFGCSFAACGLGIGCYIIDFGFSLHVFALDLEFG